MKYTKKQAQDTYTGLSAIQNILKHLDVHSSHLDTARAEAKHATQTPSATLRDGHMARVEASLARFGRGEA